MKDILTPERPTLTSSKKDYWLKNRKKLELLRFRGLSARAKRTGKISTLDHLLPIVKSGLQFSRFYKRGMKNALDIAFRKFELSFDHLPSAFDGYTILHISDLHLDGLPGLESIICQLVDPIQVDLTAITGDFRLGCYGPYTKKVTQPLAKITHALNQISKDGVLATLGNHDTHHIVDILENLQVKVLLNESHRIEKNGESIMLTGTDDPYSYFTNDMVKALEKEREQFKIALIHSPDLFAEAATNDYSLYLCGHTHAGQVCLPAGIPIISHSDKGKHLIAGFWQEGDMIGYTSPGCGTSGLPIRFNCQGEITLFTLKKK